MTVEDALVLHVVTVVVSRTCANRTQLQLAYDFCCVAPLAMVALHGDAHHLSGFKTGFDADRH